MSWGQQGQQGGWGQQGQGQQGGWGQQGQQGQQGLGQQGQGSQSGLTLPQVISVVDKRLTTLESFMKETKLSSPVLSSAPQQQPQPQPPDNLREILDEFNTRHEMLASEIGNLKNIVMSLQSYTMDVNKMLMEERVKILGDVGEGEGEGEENTKEENTTSPMLFSMSE